jgi:hypothetical protein
LVIRSLTATASGCPLRGRPPSQSVVRVDQHQPGLDTSSSSHSDPPAWGNATASVCHGALYRVTAWMIPRTWQGWPATGRAARGGPAFTSRDGAEVDHHTAGLACASTAARPRAESRTRRKRRASDETRPATHAVEDGVTDPIEVDSAATPKGSFVESHLMLDGPPPVGARADQPGLSHTGADVDHGRPDPGPPRLDRLDAQSSRNGL